MSVYEYTALPDDCSIRLLVLNPGELNAPLTGRLQVVDVNKAGLYEPVSYVWGNPTRTHRFSCDDAELKLTTSLYNALRCFRLPNKERRLWVDQLCINQDCPDERSQQVQFMNAIYWNASHVLVWLGQDDQNVAQAAFAHVQKLAETFGHEENIAKFRHDHTEDLDRQSEDNWILIKFITQLRWVSLPRAARSISPTLLGWHIVNILSTNLVYSSMDCPRNWDERAGNTILGQGRT